MSDELDRALDLLRGYKDTLEEEREQAQRLSLALERIKGIPLGPDRGSAQNQIDCAVAIAEAVLSQHPRQADVGRTVLLREELSEMERPALEEYTHTLQVLLSDHSRLLREVPECGQHGRCVPHALEWVSDAKSLYTICFMVLTYGLDLEKREAMRWSVERMQRED